tara:strand:- start:295 stop:777 length:483 start_codon:yes stop_codon:yes gene_type:complete
MPDPKKVPQNREEGIQKGIDEAYAEGARIYNDGFSSITSHFNKQTTKESVYDKDAKKAMDRGYDDAKAKDKENEAIKKIDKKLIKSGNQKIKKKSGGILKAAPNKGVTKLPKDVRNKMGFLKKGGKVKGYKDGGKVKKMKKCRMDGIALRGKTRAKQRSK